MSSDPGGPGRCRVDRDRIVIDLEDDDLSIETSATATINISSSIGQESAHDPLPLTLPPIPVLEREGTRNGKFKRKLDVTNSEMSQLRANTHAQSHTLLQNHDVDYEPPQKERCTEAMCEMSSDLECPVCMMCIVPPIKTCWRGHGICNSCFVKVKACPLCTSKLNPNQNTTLDKIVSRLLLPCAFNKLGCNQMIPIDKKLSHESGCLYRVFDCPVSLGCGWRGKQKEVAQHLKQSHINQCAFVGYNEKITRKMVFSDDFNVSPLNGLNVNVNSLIVIDDDVLVLHVKGRRERTQHYVLQSLGNEETASKFRYRLIHTSSKGVSLTYEGTPISNDLLIDNVWRSNKCHRIPWDLYMNFYEPNTQDETLQIQVFKNETHWGGDGAPAMGVTQPAPQPPSI